MRIAISACDNHFDSEVASDFMECKCFIIVNIYDLTSYDVILNHYKKQKSGADIFCAQMIISQGIDALVTGNCTPDAIRILNAANIQVYENYVGTVRKSIAYIANMLTKIIRPYPTRFSPS